MSSTRLDVEVASPDAGWDQAAGLRHGGERKLATAGCLDPSPDEGTIRPVVDVEEPEEPEGSQVIEHVPGVVALSKAMDSAAQRRADFSPGS